jgi:hypothetical protein
VLRSTSSPARCSLSVTTPEKGAVTTQRRNSLSVSLIAMRAMRSSLAARSRLAIVRSRSISEMTLESLSASCRSTSRDSARWLMPARSVSATWRSRRSSSISQSNRATAWPALSRSPGSATHSSLPAIPAVIWVWLRLNTVPAAGTRGAMLVISTSATVIGTASSCAWASPAQIMDRDTIASLQSGMGACRFMS